MPGSKAWDSTMSLSFSSDEMQRRHSSDARERSRSASSQDPADDRRALLEAYNIGTGNTRGASGGGRRKSSSSRLSDTPPQVTLQTPSEEGAASDPVCAPGYARRTSYSSAARRTSAPSASWWTTEEGSLDDTWSLASSCGPERASSFDASRSYDRPQSSEPHEQLRRRDSLKAGLKELRKSFRRRPGPGAVGPGAAPPPGDPGPRAGGHPDHASAAHAAVPDPQAGKRLVLKQQDLAKDVATFLGILDKHPDYTVLDLSMVDLTPTSAAQIVDVLQASRTLRFVTVAPDATLSTSDIPAIQRRLGL